MEGRFTAAQPQTSLFELFGYVLLLTWIDVYTKVWGWATGNFVSTLAYCALQCLLTTLTSSYFPYKSDVGIGSRFSR